MQTCIAGMMALPAAHDNAETQVMDFMPMVDPVASPIPSTSPPPSADALRKQFQGTLPQTPAAPSVEAPVESLPELPVDGKNGKALKMFGMFGRVQNSDVQLTFPVFHKPIQ